MKLSWKSKINLEILVLAFIKLFSIKGFCAVFRFLGLGRRESNMKMKAVVRKQNKIVYQLLNFHL